MDGQVNDAATLLQVHNQLHFDYRNRRGRVFLGDWYTEHPFVSEILGDECLNNFAKEPLESYYFHNDFPDIHDAISQFHQRHDGRTFHEDEIFVGSGMTPLITAQLFMLKMRGVTRLHFLRPVYANYYYLAESLGIELIPLNDSPLHEFAPLTLPDSRGEWLLICDPVWFMGRSVDQGVISQIAEWQKATDGHVLVDGAFQYTRRNGDRSEATAQLDPERTVRAICPTKAVAIHGVRFSYCLLPSSMYDDFRLAYSNVAGSGSVFDHSASLSVMRYLNRPGGNEPLLSLIGERKEQLVAAGHIKDPLRADMGYFCFVRTALDADQMIPMGQEFFNIKGFSGFTRLNLLMPERELDHFIQLSA